MKRILVRGAGDVGSAVAHRLFTAGYAVVLHNDYEFLFEPESDGIEDTEIARRAGLTEIAFSAWFDGFDNTPPVHPYVEPDPEWWKRAPVPEDLNDDGE